MSKLRVLSLFAGIGGFDLGLERTGGFETVAFCEINPTSQEVIAKHWPGAPIYDDVCGLSADRLSRDGVFPDVICGGFPCQDISMAGHRAGLEGARSGLWSEYSRLIREIRPQYVIVENVSALLSLGMGDVLRDLAAIGYDAEWHCIPASAVGAPHGRDRVWIIAYPANEQTEAGLESIQAPRLSRELGRVLGGMRVQFVDQPAVCFMDDGVPPRLDGQEALGNAVVPQIPELIGRAILASLQSDRKAA